ncbi:hypothetical protein [Flavobacterium cucumis]|uniref:Uncharacterized protein n=2 Tax=Flavobacterium cucumis TaxID=416016 RepID=A0A1M7ZZ05_9FLAO|nr:hypothetical protein [Flavobacterium cucumis]SHO74102.1 hypothetical protein SAMN05443547_2486 [Flavobacterium cucumis]
MGYGVFVMMIFAVILLILSYLIFIFLKKLQKKKLGIIIGSILASIVITPILFLTFESHFYFKSDAIEDLKIAEITLNDNFKIIGNKITGLPEYYQFTKLEISKNDRNRIINEIRNSQDFFVHDNYNFLLNANNNIESDKLIANYRFENEIIRETFEKKTGFVPISLMVILNEKSNILEIRRIED